MTLLQRAWRGARNDSRLYALSLFSVAVAFICLGASLLAVFNVKELKNRWENTGRISVYLKPGATNEEVARIKEALLQSEGVKDVTQLSAREAKQDLYRTTRDPIFDTLSEEAFSDSLEVTLSSGNQTVDRMAGLLGALPAVESVESYQTWGNRMAQVVAGGITATLMLSLLIFGAVIAVVSATVRLSLERRRMEIDVLSLVGATDRYVRGPFVVEGAVLGALGAALAMLALLGLFLVVAYHFDAELSTLMGMAPRFLPWWSFAVMAGLGALLGAGAAMGSLRKISVV